MGIKPSMHIMLRLIPLFLLFYSYKAYSQNEWVWQNPYPQANTINDISFIDSQRGYACGTAGMILKTSNGGINWNVINLYTTGSFRKIKAFDQNTVYSAGTAFFAKSLDGGLTWSLNQVQQGGNIYTMYFLNSETGYLGCNNGRILFTTNAGTDWNILQTNISGSINSIFFSDPNTGYASGAGFVVQKTTNAGNTWITVLNENIFGSCMCINFLNNLTGYSAGTGGRIMKTTDGGISWSQLNTGTASEFYTISFLGSNVIVTGENGTILTTTDGGINWNQLISNTTNTLYGAGILNPVQIILGGNTGTLLKSSNSGANWFNISVGFTMNINAVTFLNSQLGFASGDMGTILKTTNSGLTWSPSSSGISPAGNLNDPFFLNSMTGFAGNSLGELYKTVNSGADWELQEQFGSSVKSLYFTNSQTGFAGSGSTVYKTTDGGNTWLTSLSSVGQINEVQFINELTGFGVTGIGHVIKTTNAGLNWQVIHISGAGSLSEIEMLNTLTGYVTNSNKLMKTTDGGNIWTPIIPAVLPYSYSDISVVDFLNANTGYIGGTIDPIPFGNSRSAVSKTTNGGLTWSLELPGPSLNLYSMAFVNDDTCFITSSFGAILRKTNGLTSVSGNNSIPEKFALHQNYPNPFNPNTKITFDLSSIGLIRLVVYDALGREIQTLLDQELQRGSYNIDFNAGDLSSGIYYYRLIAQDFSETKKMILIK